MVGFGYSAKPRDYHYSMFDQADLMEALMTKLGVKRYHILAHDYGDTVAQELLARQNEHKAAQELLSVCFLNGGLFPETHHPRLIQRLLASPIGPLVSRLTNERSFHRSFTAVFGANTQPGFDELSEFWDLINYNDGVGVFHKLIDYMRERRENRARWVGALQKASVPLRSDRWPG